MGVFTTYTNFTPCFQPRLVSILLTIITILIWNFHRVSVGCNEWLTIICVQ
jgi:hypothetical protein